MTTSVFYHQLVGSQTLDEVLGQVPAPQRAQAETMMWHSLDYIVHETVLHHLHQDHHEEYLEKCVTSHHDPALLEWLQTKVANIVEVLTQTIKALLDTFTRIFQQPAAAI